MRVGSIVCRLFKESLVWSHAFRAATVFAAVEALMRCRRASLTAIGRMLDGHTSVKHSIKRIDRLLGNCRLHAEIGRWYKLVARKVIGGCKRPLVLVDWTKLPRSNWALSAAVACAGRAVPVYQEVHPEARLGNRDVHRKFLRALAEVLPSGCQPVIVADAGFRTPFFHACLAQGLDFVIRLRGDGTTETWELPGGGSKVRFAALHKRAGAIAQCLGMRTPYASTRSRCFRLVLGPKTKRRIKGTDTYYQRRYLEPLLLATSLENQPAADIVDVYKKRMQIEETFRDTKNARFGWALEFNGSKSPARQNVLLLLAALAFLVVFLVGLCAQDAGLARHYQANTVCHRRVLSLFALGNAFLQRPLGRLRIILRPLRAHILSLPRHFTEAHKRYRGDPPHGLYCADCGEHFAEFGWPTS